MKIKQKLSTSGYRGGRYATGLPERSVSISSRSFGTTSRRSPFRSTPFAALTHSHFIHRKVMRFIHKLILLFAIVIICQMNAFAQKENQKLEVYFFLLDECRICQEMTPHINTIYDQYKDQISFIGYFPNFSSKPEQIDTFKSTYAIPFDLKTDYFKSKASKMGVTVLPEAVLYNTLEQRILYRGRINNLFYAPGKRRHHITAHDLKSAIERALNNSIDEPIITESIGCFINFNEMEKK